MAQRLQIDEEEDVVQLRLIQDKSLWSVRLADRIFQQGLFSLYGGTFSKRTSCMLPDEGYHGTVTCFVGAAGDVSRSRFAVLSSSGL